MDPNWTKAVETDVGTIFVRSPQPGATPPLDEGLKTVEIASLYEQLARILRDDSRGQREN